MSLAPDFLGTSGPIAELETAIGAAAGSHAKVLITGETGVGKELVARLIHRRGARSAQPFVTINCGGMPDTLLESEFFGHVRGSFTDAHMDKPGLLRQAHTGTVFLDEVGEMTLRMQALLLRFLETGQLETVGGTALRAKVDVRVITATNRNLAEAVEAGQFRQDLFYRLNVLHLTIPPLRDRGADVELLLRHYIERHANEYGVAAPGLAPEAIDLISHYQWPGNVRELRNVAERLVLRRSGPIISAEQVSAAISNDPGSEPVQVQPPPTRTSVARMLDQILTGKRSFWTVVYEPFMEHDLTRDELRMIIRIGLEQARGSYRRLVELFNMPPTDHQRLMAVLREHDCDVRRGATSFVPS